MVMNSIGLMEVCVCVCVAGDSALQRLWSPEQQPDGELHIGQVWPSSIEFTFDF